MRVGHSIFVAADSPTRAFINASRKLADRRDVELTSATEMSKTGYRVSYSHNPCRYCIDQPCPDCIGESTNRGIELSLLQVHMVEWHQVSQAPKDSPPDWFDTLDALTVVHHKLSPDCAKSWRDAKHREEAVA